MRMTHLLKREKFFAKNAGVVMKNIFIEKNCLKMSIKINKIAIIYVAKSKIIIKT